MGRSDIPLSDEGQAQARALARALREEKFDSAYTSDLRRATETAETILGLAAVPLCIDTRLREFDFGDWEGLTWAEIVERTPGLASDVWTDAKAYHPAGGESFDEVKRRAASFLSDIERAPQRCVLVATHAGVLHAMLAALAPRLPLDQNGLKVVFSPASVTRVAMDAGGARLITVNDVSHLDTPT